MPVNIHGKEYTTVAERLNKIYKKLKYSISTEIYSLTEKRCVMKATLTVYAEDAVYTYTGHAYEDKDASRINQTSYIECCETSAVGRALGNAGYAGNEFASAEEVINAISNQKPGGFGYKQSSQQQKTQKKEYKQDPFREFG